MEAKLKNLLNKKFPSYQENDLNIALKYRNVKEFLDYKINNCDNQKKNKKQNLFTNYLKNSLNLINDSKLYKITNKSKDKSMIPIVSIIKNETLNNSNINHSNYYLEKKKNQNEPSIVLKKDLLITELFNKKEKNTNSDKKHKPSKSKIQSSVFFNLNQKYQNKRKLTNNQNFNINKIDFNQIKNDGYILNDILIKSNNSEPENHMDSLKKSLNKKYQNYRKRIFSPSNPLNLNRPKLSKNPGENTFITENENIKKFKTSHNNFQKNQRKKNVSMSVDVQSFDDFYAIQELNMKNNDEKYKILKNQNQIEKLILTNNKNDKIVPTSPQKVSQSFRSYKSENKIIKLTKETNEKKLKISNSLFKFYKKFSNIYIKKSIAISIISNSNEKIDIYRYKVPIDTPQALESNRTNRESDNLGLSQYQFNKIKTKT